ncbi:MAG: SAM-dependent methyltransferase, partial [Alphaproteobacteria bacterium]
VEEVVADAREYVPAQTYDVVVLDAPCSATGTWRRHPEVLHILTPADIAELAVLQAQMLARAWGWVKPGGRLLYIVCSLEREEGEDQIARFLAAHKEAKITSPVPGEITKNLIHPHPPAGAEEGWSEGVLRTHPAIQAELGGMDGFFAAILSKKP